MLVQGNLALKIKGAASFQRLALCVTVLLLLLRNCPHTPCTKLHARQQATYHRVKPSPLCCAVL